ncbi:MAG: hypothetical protein GXY36_10955 [Chloroflexi bacterium]|nr:hypothetical protein [Chloroflexota bacterium]
MSGRLVLFSDARQLVRHTLEAGDQLVPLRDDAHDDLPADLRARVVPLPDLGVLQAEALALAFDTARDIVARLDDDPAWRALLRYREYDLRPMAIKNVFFALEDAARLYRIAQVASALPEMSARLLDSDPAVGRAVRAALPGASAQADYRQEARQAARQRLSPVGRFARDRWRAWRGQNPPTSHDRPVIAFLDAPHRARIMARTLGRLAADHPVHIARLGTWDWPADLPLRPAASYAWDACMPPGAGARIARHVLGTRARTDPARFGLAQIAWLPPGLLGTLRYDDMQRYANMIEALEGLAHAQRPALWITLEDLFAFGKCAAAVGERGGIPTLNVQHGIIGAYPYRTGIDVVGTFAAFGEASRETLIARGADPARIVVTGPVRYDDILELQPDRDALLRGARLDPARPVVLFASQPARRLITPGIKRTALRALLAAAEQVGAQVVIKAHPLEDDPALEGYGVPVVRGQLYEWLLACDVLATISSTVVYEAALAERPALALEWSGNPDVGEYVAHGIALLPGQPEQVGEALRRLLHDGPTRAALLAAQRAFVARHLAGNDGKASERLAAVAKQLMGVQSG